MPHSQPYSGRLLSSLTSLTGGLIMDNDLHAKRQLPEKETGSTILYLILSFLSGVFETGVFTAGLIGFGISMGLALALAYQVGCLARNPLRLSLKGAACTLCCSLPLLLVSRDSIWAMLTVTALMSAGVQGAREWLLPVRTTVPISTKRIVRVSGFVCGIMGGFAIGLSLLAYVSVAASLAVLPMAVRQVRKVPWVSLNRRFTSGSCGWIMLFHQIHYFAYAYVLLAILFAPESQCSGEPILWQPLKASGWFALGWFSYISGKWLLKEKLKMSALPAAITGHLWVASCLICMALFHEHHFVLGLAWVLGGFGGGSVYALKELAKENACIADLELWEHWGHVIGVSLSLASILIFPRFLVFPFVVAFVAALVTLLLLKRLDC